MFRVCRHSAVPPRKDGSCGNVTPWPDLCFLKGGSRTTPECGLSVSEETVATWMRNMEKNGLEHENVEL